jgi:hypothetical protein
MFFIKYKEVLQHHWNSEDDSMTLYLRDHGLWNIPNWTDYECRLKKDWFKKLENDIKNETQQNY